LDVTISEAEDSAAATAALAGGGFDCILLDYQLPGVDGLEVLRQLRATGDRTPVIMLTGQSDAQVAAALMKAGATDYLAKGQLGPDGLASSLRSALRVTRAEAQAARAETQRQEAEEALRHSEHLLATTLRSIGDAVIATDAEGAISFMNPLAERLTGWSGEAAVGQQLHMVLPMLDGATGERLPSLADHVLRSGAVIESVDGALVEDRQGRRFPVTGSGAPIKDAHGELLGVVVVLRDITERVHHELRLRILAELSQCLASSLDYHEQLESLACLVVPHLADCCAVDLLEDEGDVERVALVAAHPRLAAVGDELLATASEVNGPRGAPFGRALARQGPLAAMRVPLVVRGASRGAISLVRAGGQGPFDPDDVAFVEELARRAAMAIDNALLYREAQEAVQIRDAFLSVASHELKTPLTSLLGYMDLLKRRVGLGTTIGDRELRRIEVANAQAHRLHKMVTSLLDLSRLQTGQLSIEQAPVELGALVRRIGEELEPTLSTHQLSVVVPSEGVTIVGDELRLEQVIQNLLSNAVKYSPYGGPISIRLSTDGEWARLAVQDKGLGIPRESLDHIFTRFYRAANSERYQVVGMGVGLFVVKQISELHGGRVEVESVEGEGSAFTLWLPLAPQAAASAYAADSPAVAP
ncbi:MAG TPA: ATP-binding protein, partial [Chloroflexaceae bacterium]|nr:ATP-binding protein [Chloroflexaceae bacterium]